jgi:hypothetical protein
MSIDPVEPGACAAFAAVALRRTLAVVSWSVALAMPMAHGQTPSQELRVAATDGLKNAYLSCHRAAIDGGLDTVAIMQCSVLYEELKRVAFGGDFEKLLAWADAQLSVRKMGEPIGADGNGPDFSCM